ncbi:MAG: fumarylacetoacetate hydrolase, partial [Pirellulales bacterium]|nr:fumarylacetoacetate hydrolase [Pirellulales bacterium]
MRWISYQSETGPRAALLTGVGYVDPAFVDSSLPTSLRQLVAAGAKVMAAAAAAAQDAPALDEESLRLLPPIIDPQKIIC